MTIDTDYGIVFDIKRFALHDGDGIRSTIFTKGCPLNCPWCHNPEGKSIAIDLMWFETLCIGCGCCIRSCPQGALSFKDKHISIDRDKCQKCGKCVNVCPTLALKLDGRKIHYKAAFAELMKDRDFFEGSGGGITISGGDPLVQHEFNYKLLALCKSNGIHTTIETCLYAPLEVVMKFSEVVDKFFIDIKILNPEKHRKIIGVDNSLILNNFEKLSVAGADICIRIPLIPGLTDSDENITEIVEYVYNVNRDIRVELLNYNPLAGNKYNSLHEEYKLDCAIEPLSAAEIHRKNNLVNKIMENSK